ncbi:MAG: hypothetical protein AAB896_01050 [Patescibacteria group bacterium]
MIIGPVKFSHETYGERVDVNLLPFEGLLFVARVAIMQVDKSAIVWKIGEAVTLRSSDPEFISIAREGGDDLLSYVFKIDPSKIDPIRDFKIDTPNISANLVHIGGVDDPRLMGVAPIVDGIIRERSLEEIAKGNLLDN